MPLVIVGVLLLLAKVAEFGPFASCFASASLTCGLAGMGI